MKKSYTIIVGETGNEIGHPRQITIAAAADFCDAAAVRAAKREVAAYRGDGWWMLVRDADGATVAKGGRFNY
jgi:hypothetical protein